LQGRGGLDRYANSLTQVSGKQRLGDFCAEKVPEVDTLTLVNLVSDTRAVPEFIGKACRAELIAPELLKLMEDPGAQMAAMDTTLERLGMGGDAPGLRAARAVLKRGFT
jgi:lipid-A-disaccharide synthase